MILEEINKTTFILIPRHKQHTQSTIVYAITKTAGANVLESCGQVQANDWNASRWKPTTELLTGVVWTRLYRLQIKEQIENYDSRVHNKYFQLSCGTEILICSLVTRSITYVVPNDKSIQMPCSIFSHPSSYMKFTSLIPTDSHSILMALMWVLAHNLVTELLGT